MARGAVSNAPLREAFLRQGRSSVEVARAAGFIRTRAGRIIPDDGHVRRVLGIKAYSPGKGYPRRYRELLDYETAVRLAYAIGVDPVDVGL